MECNWIMSNPITVNPSHLQGGTTQLPTILCIRDCFQYKHGNCWKPSSIRQKKRAARTTFKPVPLVCFKTRVPLYQTKTVYWTSSNKTLVKVWGDSTTPPPILMGLSWNPHSTHPPMHDVDQWIGWREQLQENPYVSWGKKAWFPV